MFDINKSIAEKEKIQFEAVDLLYDYRKILLSWATGCGKTLASLKMVKEYTHHFPNSKGYIICKERSHLANWEDDINKHNMQFINKITEKFLYASLHKYSDKGYVDFVILDECHAVTQSRNEHLRKIIGPNTVVIMLSATVDKKNSLLLRTLLTNYKEFHISISNAIDRGILPMPKVFVHLMDLSKLQKEEYYKITNRMEMLQEEYEENPSDWLKLRILRTGSKRKGLMVSFKTDFAKKVIGSHLKGSRYICFTGSKEQCNEIGGHNIVHSGIDKEKIFRKRRDFNTGKIDNIYAVNMFREAVNLKNIEKGLIVQLDNVKLSFIQMLGRVFRSLLPEMHIIVLKNTQDEVYLHNVMKGFNTEYVKYINYEKTR